jgi:type VI secretion system protein ImpF
MLRKHHQHSDMTIADNRSNRQPLPVRPHAHLLPTLFDRLRDDHPQRRTESAAEIALSRTKMLQIVQRDLAYLLNTTNMHWGPEHPHFPAVESSTLNYGIPPLAGGYLSEKKWRDFESIIHKAILHFEPRILPDSLHVVPYKQKDDSEKDYNILKFEIRGLVRMNPYPIEFLVQSSVDLETNRLALNMPV